MTQELTVLVILGLMASALWIPYIVGVNMQPDTGTNPFVSPPNKNNDPDWMRRANRAHMNLLEQLLPFAILVLVAHVANISTGITVAICWIFLGLRIAHAVVMMTGKPQWALRPIIFTAGFVCILVLGWQILSA
jgi:uncharacterized MAPEG superfamily protein